MLEVDVAGVEVMVGVKPTARARLVACGIYGWIILGAAS